MSLPTLTGEKIALRQLKRSDAYSIAAHANDREVTRWVYLPYPYRLVDAQTWIRQTHQLIRSRKAYPFGIVDNKHDEIVGMIGLHQLIWVNKSAEVGYWLGRNYWRRGIMTEALKLILEYAFNQLGLVRVQARVHRPNEASSLLLKKCGFTYEGAWRKASWKNDDWYDFLWYSILDDEYREGHNQKNVAS